MKQLKKIQWKIPHVHTSHTICQAVRTTHDGIPLAWQKKRLSSSEKLACSSRPLTWTANRLEPSLRVSYCVKKALSWTVKCVSHWVCVFPVQGWQCRWRFDARWYLARPVSGGEKRVDHRDRGTVRGMMGVWRRGDVRVEMRTTNKTQVGGKWSVRVQILVRKKRRLDVLCWQTQAEKYYA